jgi:ABC-type transporter Mla subunit MlaD
MGANANYFKIGLFVLLGCALLAGGLIFLGAGSMFRPRIYLETYVDGTVQGMDVGSPVKFRGVPIGRISRIDFCFNEYGPNPAGGRLDYVYLEMQVDVNVFQGMLEDDIGPLIEEAVAQGLRVMMQPQGITGLNFAELNYVTQPERAPPLEIWWTPRNYYIPSAPGTLTSMLDSVNRIMDTVNAVDVEDTMMELKRSLHTFNTTLDQFSASLRELQVGRISSDVQSLLADLKAKIDRVPVEQLSEDGRKTMASLSSASDEMKTLVESLQTSPLLNADAVGAIVGDFRATAENFRVLSENLREYPSQLLLGSPPKRSPFDPPAKPERRR